MIPESPAPFAVGGPFESGQGTTQKRARGKEVRAMPLEPAPLLPDHVWCQRCGRATPKSRPVCNVCQRRG